MCDRLRRFRLFRRRTLSRAGLGYRRFREDVAARQRDVPLAGEAVDELARHDLFDGARCALHFDTVIALEQRRHFLTRRAEQFRDFVNPNSCQTLLPHYSCCAASPRAAARIFSAVLPPMPGISDNCSALAVATDSWLTKPASTSLRTVFSPIPASVNGTGTSAASGTATASGTSEGSGTSEVPAISAASSPSEVPGISAASSPSVVSPESV